MGQSLYIKSLLSSDVEGEYDFFNRLSLKAKLLYHFPNFHYFPLKIFYVLQKSNRRFVSEERSYIFVARFIIFHHFFLCMLLAAENCVAETCDTLHAYAKIPNQMH